MTSTKDRDQQAAAPAANQIERYWPVRAAFAVLCGMLAGGLSGNALRLGVNLLLQERNWNAFYWSEHWLLRLPASWLATAVAGVVCGAVARRKGGVLSVVSNAPAELWWLFLGSYWFANDGMDAGSVVMTLVILVTKPFIAYFFGTVGADQGLRIAMHSDARRYSLLGIRFFHYFWLPILLTLLVADATWAFLFQFEEWGMLWRRGVLSSAFFYAPLFSGVVALSFELVCVAIVNLWKLLAGYDRMLSRWDVTRGIVAQGFIAPAVAIGLQFGAVCFYDWVEPFTRSDATLIVHREWGASSPTNAAAALVVGGMVSIGIVGSIISSLPAAIARVRNE